MTRSPARSSGGFGIEELRRTHPRLVVCSITGGPESPARVGISIVDIAAGATAYSAVLEALIARGVSGEGADIRVSMFDVMADWLTVPLLHYEGGKPPLRVGLAHPSIAPYGVFKTKDVT